MINLGFAVKLSQPNNKNELIILSVESIKAIPDFLARISFSIKNSPLSKFDA